MSNDNAREEFLNLALECGAILTGKPDASEPIEVHFSLQAWRAFDRAVMNGQYVMSDQDANVYESLGEPCSVCFDRNCNGECMGE